MRQRGMDSSSSWTAHGGMTSACAGVSMENALKEHRTRQRVKLLSSGFHGITAASGGCDTVKEPVDGMDECARGVFLRAKPRRGDLFAQTLYSRRD